MKRTHHWTWVMMMLYMVGQVLVGIMGIYDPSPSLDKLDLVDLYSALSAIFAVLGIVGLFCRPKVVMWAIYGMALASAVHGASIMLLPTGSLQTGVGLAIAPLMMVSMGHIWWKYHVLDSLLNREEAKS